MNSIRLARVCGIVMAILCAGGDFTGIASVASAQTPPTGAYPTKPITIIAGRDTLSGIISEKLSERLKQPVFVEPPEPDGAAGLNGPKYVAKAAPDGYTLLLTYQHVVIWAALGKLALKDFAPIMRVASRRWILAVHPSIPVNTLREFVAYTHANRGKVEFSSPHVAGLGHLVVEVFKMKTEADLVHVPSATIADADVLGKAVNALVSSNVAFAAVPIDMALPLIKSGKIKPLAVTGTGRSSLAPEVPTVAEAGVPDININIWTGLWAPAGTPKEIIAKLNSEITHIMNLPETRNALLQLGIETTPSTTEQFSKLIDDDLARWKQVISTARPPIRVEDM